MRHVLTLLLMLFAVASAALATEDRGTPADGRITGKAALERLVTDQTLYGVRSDGLSDIEYHHPDGRSAYWYDGCLYRGQWWATEEMLCYLYPTTTWVGPHCFTAERWAGQLYMVGVGGAVGMLSIEITDVVAGNSEGFPLDAEGECELVSQLSDIVPEAIKP